MRLGSIPARPNGLPGPHPQRAGGRREEPGRSSVAPPADAKAAAAANPLIEVRVSMPGSRSAGGRIGGSAGGLPEAQRLEASSSGVASQRSEQDPAWSAAQSSAGASRQASAAGAKRSASGPQASRAAAACRMAGLCPTSRTHPARAGRPRSTSRYPSACGSNRRGSARTSGLAPATPVPDAASSAVCRARRAGELTTSSSFRPRRRRTVPRRRASRRPWPESGRSASGSDGSAAECPWRRSRMVFVCRVYHRRSGLRNRHHHRAPPFLGTAAEPTRYLSNTPYLNLARSSLCNAMIAATSVLSFWRSFSPQAPIPRKAAEMMSAWMRFHSILLPLAGSVLSRAL